MASNKPEIALLDVIDKVASLVVNGGDTAAAIKDVCPFSFLVPVKLTNDPLV